jgi:hypothetical protein
MSAKSSVFPTGVPRWTHTRMPHSRQKVECAWCKQFSMGAQILRALTPLADRLQPGKR